MVGARGRGGGGGGGGLLGNLLWVLLLVNVFTAGAGALVGRRMESVRTGVLAYLAVSLVASALVLVAYAGNVCLAALAGWWARRHHR
ncbi:MAG TPA: hypothetical protein VK936_08150 [Longimicrobiales bacterium]|nr:hypothetical protein [Longimicrobiales bacterium]